MAVGIIFTVPWNDFSMPWNRLNDLRPVGRVVNPLCHYGVGVGQ